MDDRSTPRARTRLVTHMLVAAACALGSGTLGCLEHYEWVGGEGSGAAGDSGGAAGSGGAGDGGSVGAAGAGGPSACTNAPHGRSATLGPYGTEQIYFGTPELDDSLADPFDTQGGSVSPDGLRYVQGSMGGNVLETVRADVFESWDTELPPHFTFFEIRPRLSADNLHLYSCHGGELKCTIHSRPNTDDDAEFVVEYYFEDNPPFDGDTAKDFALTPVPGGRTIAFASNRISPADDVPAQPDTDLWIAHAAANDYTNPPRDFVDLEHMAVPSAADANDEPSWLSDDALTMIFHSDRSGDWDVLITQRASHDEPFGPPVVLPISTTDSSETHLSMPSVATLKAQPCGAGWAYVHSRLELDPNAVRVILRIPVCVGAPCS